MDESVVEEEVVVTEGVQSSFPTFSPIPMAKEYCIPEHIYKLE